VKEEQYFFIMPYSDDDELDSETSNVTDQSSTDYESDSMSDSQESNESDSSLQENRDDDDDFDWERI
jgi:hypothetical protein